MQQVAALLPLALSQPPSAQTAPCLPRSWYPAQPCWWIYSKGAAVKQQLRFPYRWRTPIAQKNNGECVYQQLVFIYHYMVYIGYMLVWR